MTDVDENGDCIIDKTSSKQRERACSSAICNKDRVVSGMKRDRVWSKVDGPWYEGVADAQSRHNLVSL